MIRNPCEDILLMHCPGKMNQDLRLVNEMFRDMAEIVDKQNPHIEKVAVFALKAASKGYVLVSTILSLPSWAFGLALIIFAIIFMAGEIFG